MLSNKILNIIAIRVLMVLVCSFILTHSPMTGYAEGAAKKRIIILETMPVPVVIKNTKWFLFHLKEIGYRDGLNIEIEILKAEGDAARAGRLLQNALSKGRPDLVVTNATMASKTGYKMLKGTDVPVLFFSVSDPVGAGLIKNVGSPSGSNITGIVNTVPRRTKIDLVLRLLGNKFKGSPMRAGFIYSAYPSSMGDLGKLVKLTEGLSNIVFVPYKIEYRKVPDEINAMKDDLLKGVKHLEGRIDFLWTPQGPLGVSPAFVETLAKNATVPIGYSANLNGVKQGALLSISPSYKSTGQKAAIIADAILKGTNPGEIPVTPPDKFSLGINLKTALDMGIAVPSDVMEMAGENIYR